MAEYKGINGTKVQNYSSDPSNPIKGQVWYNETTNTLKVESETTAGAWATGGNLNTARYLAQNGAGTQTAGLVFGGHNDTTTTAVTESYNGSAWTEVNDMNTARLATGAGGTQTSALVAGGDPFPTSAAESWNGTNWTAVNSLNTARRYLAGAIAVNTAGIVFGGLAPSTTYANTELWNGTNWTEVNDLATARRSNAGVGSSTAGLAMGGYVTGTVANCESWNGTNWTEVNDQSNAGGGEAFGTLASAVKMGGSGNVVELWNGTNWSAGTNNPVTLSNRSGIGTSSLGLLAGGESPASVATEEYTGAGVVVTKTITAS